MTNPSAKQAVAALLKECLDSEDAAKASRAAAMKQCDDVLKVSDARRRFVVGGVVGNSMPREVARVDSDGYLVVAQQQNLTPEDAAAFGRWIQRVYGS